MFDLFPALLKKQQRLCRLSLECAYMQYVACWKEDNVSAWLIVIFLYLVIWRIGWSTPRVPRLFFFLIFIWLTDKLAGPTRQSHDDPAYCPAEAALHPQPHLKCQPPLFQVSLGPHPLPGTNTSSHVEVGKSARFCINPGFTSGR